MYIFDLDVHVLQYCFIAYQTSVINNIKCITKLHLPTILSLSCKLLCVILLKFILHMWHFLTQVSLLHSELSGSF